ncbi:cytochrome c oxidase assembly protein [Streptomyces sp. NRRL F-4489]|uniref:cytochrome c oxidase assembly protein n=1 Tax=Streptomyces sp. NRRL F-4489 TaxID=1609095 RepID=UPI00082EE64F|nr:cytochrome c oxidase assembly protein [Streptomyces sp. NRRL F-4489]
MIPPHALAHHTTGTGPPPGVMPLAGALLAAGALYVLGAALARHRNPAADWSRWRTASFLCGLALLGAALLPPVASLSHADFRGHMLQHLLIGMYAPLALVLGAPVTLLLRTLPVRHARRLARLLRGRCVRAFARPAVALLLSVGTLPLLYLTPLYPTVTGHPLGHPLLHLHFLLSGCLFAWVIAGPDPAPARPGVPARLVVLGVAVAAHATVSQMIYAGLFLGVPAPPEQIQGGAALMYYGGDLAELLLAAALVSTWRPTRRPRTPPGRWADARGATRATARTPASGGTGTDR